MNRSIVIVSFLLSLCAWTGTFPTARAAEAVISNLEADGSASSVISDSTGAPLAAGCHLRLVMFPGKSDAQIAGIANSGLAALLEQSEIFGTSSVIGSGGADPGRLEFQTGEPITQPLTGLHLLVVNGTDPAIATECLLLRLPMILPADELSGPAAHTSVHLADAELVFGSTTAAGFSTASAGAPSGFESWIGSMLGGGFTEADRLPDADPDRDGRVNLLEYATGTLPADATQVECLKLQRGPGDGTQAIFLRRAGDEGILCRIDYRQDLGEGDWSELTSAITTPAEVPFPAPEGCEWVRQALPAGDSGFVRLRVELVP
jgi:hypothetical protein